jgi:hypothetical protein
MSGAVPPLAHEPYTPQGAAAVILLPVRQSADTCNIHKLFSGIYKNQLQPRSKHTASPLQIPTVYGVSMNSVVSYERSITSSKASSPQTASKCFLFQFTVFSLP